MIANLNEMAREADIIENAIGRTTMYPCRGIPGWLDDRAVRIGHLDSHGDRLVAYDTPTGIFVAMVCNERGRATWYQGELTRKRLEYAEHEIDQRARDAQSFCACGRRVSECDGSRRGCRR